MVQQFGAAGGAGPSGYNPNYPAGNLGLVAVEYNSGPLGSGPLGSGPLGGDLFARGEVIPEDVEIKDGNLNLSQVNLSQVEGISQIEGISQVFNSQGTVQQALAREGLREGASQADGLTGLESASSQGSQPVAPPNVSSPVGGGSQIYCNGGGVSVAAATAAVAAATAAVAGSRGLASSTRSGGGRAASAAASAARALAETDLKQPLPAEVKAEINASLGSPLNASQLNLQGSQVLDMFPSQGASTVASQVAAL